MKRIIALILAVVMVLGLTACGNSAEEAAKADINKNLDAISGKLDDVIAALENSNIASGTPSGDVQTGDVSTEETSEEASTDASGEATTEAGSSSGTTTAQTNTDYTKTDPSKWTTAQVIDYYKKAAAATEKAGCKSKQTMTLESLDGGDGFVGSVIGLFEDAGKKALSENSTTYDGLTGNYEKLTASDVKSATAKKSGNYIIVNIIPKDQTDGLKGNEDGTVAHVVGILDSISTAIESMGIKAEYPEGSVTLLYNNAHAKDIKINASTLKIESGTWGHTVNASINGMKAFGVTLKNAKAVIKYTITLTK